MQGSSSSRKKMRLAVLTGLGFVGVLLFAVYWQGCILPQSIIRYVERGLDLQVSGKVQPVWGKFEFSMGPLKTLWDQRIKINSGRVRVRYEISDFLAGQLRVVISGENVDAELLGDWVSIAGGHSAVFKDLYADLVMSHDGIKEIRALRAESPAIQFRFGEATNRRLKETHEA